MLRNAIGCHTRDRDNSNVLITPTITGILSGFSKIYGRLYTITKLVVALGPISMLTKSTGGATNKNIPSGV